LVSVNLQVVTGKV